LVEVGVGRLTLRLRMMVRGRMAGAGELAVVQGEDAEEEECHE
jgi:hypothetical protein